MEEALIRGFENLMSRPDGPLSFRFLIQPTVAIILAIRAGLRDAHNKEAPFLWSLFSNADQRTQLLSQGWKDVRTVFIVALVFDAVFQVMMHSSIFAGELIVTAILLAIVPYVLIRGLVTRIASHFITANLLNKIDLKIESNQTLKTKGSSK